MPKAKAVKKQNGESYSERLKRYEQQWGAKSVNKYLTMSNEEIKETIRVGDSKGESNAEISWKRLGCADSIMRKLREKVGAPPSKFAREPKKTPIELIQFHEERIEKSKSVINEIVSDEKWREEVEQTIEKAGVYQLLADKYSQHV